MSTEQQHTELQQESEISAAGYVDPHREVDECHDHRRTSDRVLHWQNRPKVYPFKHNSDQRPHDHEEKLKSMYVSDFVPKASSIRKFRPSSLNRRNKPHPSQAFHVRHMFNQGVPVVRTRMTLEEFYRKPIDSPYVSNTHRAFRTYNRAEIQPSKSCRQAEENVTGIVPELNKPDQDAGEIQLFPVIPRNSRLTADKARELTNSVLKPRKNKYQPHLSAAGASASTEQVFPFLPVKDLNKPSLKPIPGSKDTLHAASWDGAPSESARTTSRVFGRKRLDPTKIDDLAKAAVPALPPPTSKSLMFKEYVQYPKYAPQMLQEYYSGRTRKSIIKPYVY